MSGRVLTARRVEWRAVARDDDPDGLPPNVEHCPWRADRADALADYDEFRSYEPPRACWFEGLDVAEPVRTIAVAVTAGGDEQ